MKRPDWWNSCPPNSRKVAVPLAKEVPVNYFHPLGPLFASVSLDASSSDVTVLTQS